MIYRILPASTPLESIDRDALQRVTGHFFARPISKKTKKPLAVETVKTVLQNLRQLLNWADGDLWKGPHRWDKLFVIRWNGLRTATEQKQLAMGKKTFELAELKDLYAEANDRTRLFMLLGLNCGFGQKEIATLLREDIRFEPVAVIDRIRNKTRTIAAVRGQWRLWRKPRRCCDDSSRGPGMMSSHCERKMAGRWSTM